MHLSLQDLKPHPQVGFRFRVQGFEFRPLFKDASGCRACLTMFRKSSILPHLNHQLLTPEDSAAASEHQICGPQIPGLLSTIL